LTRFYRDQNWKTLFGLCLLGVAAHVIFDLLNSYGVVLLYPFQRTRFELGWVFIIDLALWGLLIAPLLLSRIKSERTELKRLSQIFMGLVAIYVGCCGALHARSESLLKRWAETARRHPVFSAVFPEALGPHRFRGVLREGNRYDVLMIHAPTGGWEPVDAVETHDTDPVVEKIRATEMGKKIEWFFKAPVWFEDPPGTWNVTDLRFSSVIFRRNPFVYRFTVTNEGIKFVGR
jgi:hypothetical protein